ncbi:hypothetical protein K435DRAFT_933080 [Dendrothele bispora CBS 962.96]|uniref:Uncharacterized protein n=1 Tax=Dendrothele bispora (strain CBS 962.96) TaxID=1314807 RepID=A0A4S8L287_DENBC|nr:hypothetical protein K435DRAFT_933080 [Dendrothele bispora CBS 962.96]
MFPITLPFISSWTASDKDSFRTVGWFKKLDSPWDSIHGKEGTLLEHGWTRFHYDATIWGKNFTTYVYLPETLEKKLVSAWLCQGMFYVNATGGDTSRLEEYDVGTAVLHPNIIPKNTFLFIAPVSLNQCPESGSAEVSWGEHEEKYYWSLDPDGSTQISQRVCDLIGLPQYTVEISAVAFYSFNYQFQAIQQVQKFFGYDPLTQDFAKACGLPLIEVISLSENPEKSHDQSIEELHNWNIVHNILDEGSSSDSESIHENTSAQSEGIWFPMPWLRQEMNLTVAEILSYQDLDASELDSCSEDWSDLGSETSKFDPPSDVSIQYLEPNVPDAGPPEYTERWICVECHYSHFWVQPVTCAKCGTWFGTQSPWPEDNIMVLKIIHKNYYVDI